MVITITITEINNLLKNYTIINGTIYQKENNQVVQDEEIILKVKTARLIYNEARSTYQDTIKQFGKSSKDLEWFIKDWRAFLNSAMPYFKFPRCSLEIDEVN